MLLDFALPLAAIVLGMSLVLLPMELIDTVRRHWRPQL